MAILKLIFCGVLAMGAAPILAQSTAVTAAKLPDAASASASGRWLGAFDTVHPDGTVDESEATFVLKQDGNTITGTAGQSEKKMDPVSGGEIHGQRVRFVLVVHQNVSVRFALKLEGDRLRGEATGLPLDPGSKILVNVARWPQGSAAPEIVHVKDDGLFATVSALDTKLFDAYNHCDLATLGSLVTDDLEFYHDKTGLSTGKQIFLDAIKNNICPGHVHRTLVPGTLEVYPLRGYGAVEIGIHRFHHAGEPENVGEAKFLTVWQNKDGVWKISRAISYDHEPVKQ